MHGRVQRAACAAAAVVGLAAGLTACGGNGSGTSGDGPSSSSPAATTTAPPAKAAPAATTPSTPDATPSTMRPGQTYHWDDGDGTTGTATVIAYRQPVLRDDPPNTDLGVPAGSQWGRLDIKVCLTTGDPISVSQDPWHLQFSDGSQADNTGLNGGDFPKPEFPQGSTVPIGQCARGGIMFPVPKGQHPVSAVYSPDSVPMPVYWALAAKG